MNKEYQKELRKLDKERLEKESLAHDKQTEEWRFSLGTVEREMPEEYEKVKELIDIANDKYSIIREKADSGELSREIELEAYGKKIKECSKAWDLVKSCRPKEKELKELAEKNLANSLISIHEEYLSAVDILYKKYAIDGSMRDIVVYTNPERLELKKGNNGYKDFYWSFDRVPKTMPCVNRIFFAKSGFVVGFFDVEMPDNDHRYSQIYWNPKTWTEIEPVPIKAFRGFRYRWFDIPQNSAIKGGEV
jgi:hypothetical protein